MMHPTIQRSTHSYVSGGPQRDRSQQQGNMLTASSSASHTIGGAYDSFHTHATIRPPSYSISNPTAASNPAQHNSSSNHNNNSSNLIFGPSVSTSASASFSRGGNIERDHIDLKIPLNRPEITYGGAPIPTMADHTTDMISAKTKIAELQKVQDHLKHMVHRLSEELARYQTKYPALSREEQMEILQVSEKDLSSSSLPPWMLASEQMNPLLVAYDTRIYEVERQNTLYKERINEMTSQIRTLIQENDSLNEKLSQSLLSKVKQAEKGTLGDVIHQSSTVGSEEWRDLQERSKLLEEENNVLLEENNSLRKEVNRLREESKKIVGESHSIPILDGDRDKVLLRNAHLKLQSMQLERENALKQVQIYVQKVKQLQSEINQLNSTLNASSMRHKELEQNIDGYMRQISNLERERDRYLQQEKTYKRMEFDVQEYRERIKSLDSDVIRLQGEREKLLRDISDQEQRLINHQTSEFEALQKVEQSAEMIENLRVEKEGTRKQNENYRQEIDRLEKKIKKMTEEHADKCRQLVIETHEKDQYTISSLREEIRQLQMESAHTKSQIERAEREKKNAEEEVNKIIKAAESDHVANPHMIAELNRKIQFANTERDEAERMYENLRSAQKRATLQWEQEREQLHVQISEHSKRVIKMERELHDERENNKRLARELDTVQKAIQNLQFEKQDQERSLKEKITELVETHKFQLHDLTRRMHESESKIFQAEKDYQMMILKNEELETKYRTASEKLGQLAKERTELARYSEEMEKECMRTRHQLEMTKSRAEQNANTVRSLLDKEADLLRERKELHLQVDRKNMELERSFRDRETLARRMNDLNKSGTSAYPYPGVGGVSYPADTEDFEDKIFPVRLGQSLPTRRRYPRSSAATAGLLRNSVGGKIPVSSSIDV